MGLRKGSNSFKPSKYGIKLIFGHKDTFGHKDIFGHKDKKGARRRRRTTYSSERPRELKLITWSKI